MNVDIERVLDFWFGGDLETNYKTKWFPTGTKNLQKIADQEIKSKFESLLSDAVVGHLDSWCDEPKSTVALIVILDQFSR